MLPLHDDNPTRRVAFLTLLIIALNVAIFVWQSSRPEAGGFMTEAEFARTQDAVVCEFGVLPDRVVHKTNDPEDLCALENQQQNRLTGLITHQFIHGSWAHLLGNMLFLFIFGNNVEDRLGRIRFLPFYLLCGLIAAFGQILVDPGSNSLLIGASGAISGVLGAYLVMFPRARVLALVAIIPMRLPAWIVLLGYIAFQFFYVSQASATEGGGGVAYWAHIFGFAAGIALAYLLTGGRPRPHRQAPTTAIG